MRTNEHMLFLKGCPKCGGDVARREDNYGAYVTCLQCGYIRDLDGSKDARPGKAGEVKAA